MQLDGQIIIGGLFTNVNGSILPHVARLNADGTVDASFNPGMGANDAVFSIGVQTDNRIVLGGEFTLASGVTRNRITRLNPDGSVDPTINFGYGANSFVSAIAIQEDIITGYPTNVPDEKIILGGGFTTARAASPGGGGGWRVDLNSDTLPRVLIDQSYHTKVSNNARSDAEKNYLSECLNQANWLIKSLDQRARTILKVAAEIVRQQDSFFVYGVQYLRPLNLKTVAEAVGMHESTISRVTTNKYVATPRAFMS